MLETKTLSLSVYEPIAMQILLGGPSPNLRKGFELGGRVWYHLKVLHIRYNLFAGNEMLSLSVYETIALQIWLGGPSPNLGEGVELGDRVWCPVKLLHIRYNLFA